MQSRDRDNCETTAGPVPDAGDTRRAYQRPELREYGDIRDITQSNYFGAGAQDNSGTGFWAQQYKSRPA